MIKHIFNNMTEKQEKKFFEIMEKIDENIMSANLAYIQTNEVFLKVIYTTCLHEFDEVIKENIDKKALAEVFDFVIAFKFMKIFEKLYTEMLNSMQGTIKSSKFYKFIEEIPIPEIKLEKVSRGDGERLH